MSAPKLTKAQRAAALIEKQRSKIADLDSRIGRLMTARVDAEERLATLLDRQAAGRAALAGSK